MNSRKPVANPQLLSFDPSPVFPFHKLLALYLSSIHVDLPSSSYFLHMKFPNL